MSLLVCLAWGQSYSYRYWTDNDVGSAVSGSGTGETQFSVNTSALSIGIHSLHVQPCNAAGVWGSVQTRYFLKQVDESQEAVTARYWIDNDLATMHNGVATSGVIELDLSGVGVGIHAVHYQKIAADGTPSPAHTRYFLRHEDESHEGATARYWIDNDLTTMHNGMATNGTIDIDISGLGVGIHTVHYQKIAADGTPSPAHTRYFFIDHVQAGPFTASISIDDGEATSYPVTDEEIVIDLGELEGEHLLHVALYDGENRLVGEQTQTFDAGQRTHIIDFGDEMVKLISTYYWDTDEDGELSEDEAAAVTDIGDAFSGYEDITSLNDLRYFTGLTSIPDFAFANCSQMQSIVIPKNVQAVGGGIFYFCDALESVTVDEENPYFDSRGCNAIFETATNTLLDGCKTTVIPDGVTAISYMAFYHVHGMGTLTLPATVESLGLGCFFGMMDIESLTIPKSVVSIGSEALGNMNELSTLVVEEGNPVYDSRDQCNGIIETATNTLISGCRTTVIPTTVTAIAECAFDSTPLTELDIPASVVEIDDYAVRLCHSLSSITVAAGNTRYDSRGGCNAIMETQADKLLIGCMSTSIPDGTRSIGTFAFNGCEYMEYVIIPESVKSIGSYAFNGCTELTSVAVGMTEPVDITEDTFTSSSYATLYVPYGCRAAYEAADYWRDFYEIVETDIDDIGIPNAEGRQPDAYDLMGRRVNDRKKPGLYIIGDRKMLVK